MGDTANLGYKERRREAHTQAEQKRRDAIKRGYEELQRMVPKCQQQDSVSSYKLSKATILQRSIEYMQSLQSAKLKQQHELVKLSKQVRALEIIRDNYEVVVKRYQASPQGSMGNNQLTDQVKFEIFKKICDTLFLTFDQCVSFDNFSTLSASIFTWLEEQCKPQCLGDLVWAIVQPFYQSGNQNHLSS